ncbi:rhomboid family intramembrane serine protease [Nocardioides gansuensis]|uniref:Rhomboid family intramembrane serine protease n=1 Tax=Nocardioides gansuensis TaxID=2138300 RepID=A0A2T8FEH3_9ACTN|nr:rhomboid family intramembrane serine protease [Nocardioides gansuensis]PVG84095.1 rhomboid family intramembrane serine protease [Nocardioides gansuensis]
MTVPPSQHGPSAGGEPPAGVPTCYRHAGRETWIRCQRCERPICPDCMRDAAVGFQCPSCVAEGAKSTRQGRAAYGGARSANPALTSLVLIGINLAVWLGVLTSGWRNSRLIELLGLRADGACAPGDGYVYDLPEGTCVAEGAVWLPGVVDGAWWQLVSSAFLHVELWHIAGNMLALYMLGPQLEAVLGRVRFLALYLIAGLAGSVAAFWLASPLQLTLGASGAIYGLFGALLVLVIKVGADLRPMLGLLAVNLFITFAVPNISWQGHLGGFLAGLAVTAILVYAPRARRSQLQLLGVGGLGAALLVLTAVRAAALT